MKAISALGFAFLLALAACGGGGSDETRDCTAMACRDGLIVTLENPPNEPYRVDATAGAETRTQTCQTRNCPTFVFAGFMPSSVSVAVVLAATGATWGSVSATPSYGRVFPNGPQCGGDCLQGMVTVRQTN